MNRSEPNPPLTSGDGERARCPSRQSWPIPRPDFHPDASDRTGLVETWGTGLFGDNGTLNDELIGVAA
ncbi:MAG: hypothetical protein P4L86_17425 [Mycobacterium sp.]|nr:hypothetical protein [Mycobacterium sp.]